MRIKNTWISGLGIPLTSIFLGLLVGAIIMLLSGFDPISNYVNMFTGALGSANAIGEVLRSATPLMLTALGFAVANYAGFFNIGLAGQALVGWLASVAFANAFPGLPSILIIPGALIVAALAGAFWSGLAGYFRAYFGANEVITTIMLNYIALYATNAIVKAYMTVGDGDYSKMIPKAARLRTPFLEQLTQNSTFHYGIILSVLAVFFIAWLLKKTTLGFEIRAVGMSEDASRYAGMSPKRTIMASMLISGALCGLGGAMEGLGNFQNIIVNTALPSIGFDGMSVALLAAGSPIGILFAALLFGTLSIGGLNISIAATTPPEITSIVVASIIFFVGANYIIRYWFAKLRKPAKPTASTPVPPAATDTKEVHS
ncbi:ABC transporter permease [Lacticaseibacillus daqingensis]|uniref:ABC transporter permease n=1 Tax=Lacticaseibacillus daqingensis TaxID=2486014 RepID=UPI000F783464|nr:ABC transporter permease [Lacticaseibacillus daqingensis]